VAPHKELEMPVTVRNTDILFNDNSTQNTAAVPEFVSGTVMMFAQTAAPTGWTKNTTAGNQHALRLVTGTAGSGGSVDFTTAFASQPVTGTVSVSGSAGATTLTTPQIPSHSHTTSGSSGPLFGFDSTGYRGGALNTSSTGGGGSHTHPLSISSSTFSGNAINIAVRYIDVIRATKN